MIEQKSVDDKGRPTIRKVPGATKWSNISLKRGVDESLDIWKWRETWSDSGPDSARVDGNIALIDYSGSTIARGSSTRAGPSSTRARP